MSLENQGVFQLLKEGAFRGILALFNSPKWGHFGVICGWLSPSFTNPRLSKAELLNSFKYSWFFCHLLISAAYFFLPYPLWQGKEECASYDGWVGPF